MEKILFIFSVLFSTLLLGNDISKKTLTKDNQSSYIKGDKIYYNGEINKENNNAIYKLYYSQKIKPKTIYLNCKSSDLRMAIELGEFVTNNKLNTQAGDYCIGDCANYVFLAGQKKIVSKYSILAFDVGIYSQDYKRRVVKSIKIKNTSITQDKIDEKYKKEIENLELRVKAIYKISKVDFYFSKLATQDEFKDKINSSYIIGYYFDMKDMKSLKINNLYFSPKGWFPENEIDGKTILELKLNCDSSCTKEYCKSTNMCLSKEEKIALEEKKQNMDDNMDFSGVIVESNEIDENEEKEEEKEIDKNIQKYKKVKKVKTEKLIAPPKKEKKNFIKFLPIYLELSYFNTQLLKMKQNHTFFAEFGLSLFALKIFKLNINLGRAAIALTYDTGFMSYEFSPLNLSYSLDYKSNKFLLELDLYKKYNLFERLKWDKIYMTDFVKYISLKSSWFIFDRKESNMRLFFETSIVNGSHRDISTSVAFSLGLAGEFYPIFFGF